MVIGLITNQARQAPATITEVPPRLHPEATVTDLGTAWHDHDQFSRTDPEYVTFIRWWLQMEVSRESSRSCWTLRLLSDRLRMRYVPQLVTTARKNPKSLHHLDELFRLSSRTILEYDMFLRSWRQWGCIQRDLTTLIAWWTWPTSLGPIQSTLRFSARDPLVT